MEVSTVKSIAPAVLLLFAAFFALPLLWLLPLIVRLCVLLC